MFKTGNALKIVIVIGLFLLVGIVIFIKQVHKNGIR